MSKLVRTIKIVDKKKQNKDYKGNGQRCQGSHVAHMARVTADVLRVSGGQQRQVQNLTVQRERQTVKAQNQLED